MNSNELKDYILKYSQDSSVIGALMIDAPWGAGKSYFINNTVIPSISDPRGKSYILISISSVLNVSEISKKIFFEYKFGSKIRRIKRRLVKNNVCTDSESGKNQNKIKVNIVKKLEYLLTCLKIIPRAVSPCVGSVLHLDLKIDEKTFKELYTKVDLSKTLLIFEDIERSNVNIADFFGLVSDLTENRHVKILLVANETELLNKSGFDAKYYQKIKEKAVYETVSLFDLTPEIILDIVHCYPSKKLKELVCKFPSIDKDLLQIVNEVGLRNLRSVHYSIKKSMELFDLFSFEVDYNFLRILLLGDLAFVLKKKSDDSIHWINDEKSPSELGTSKYPLQRFCYDYLCYHTYFDEVAKNTFIAFKGQKEYEQKQTKLYEILNVIFNYYTKRESDVKLAVDSIEKYLESDNKMPVPEYVRLVNYLVAIKSNGIAVNSVDHCKELILEKVKDADPSQLLYSFDGIELDSKDAYDEFAQFRKDLRGMMTNISSPNFKFDYSVNSIPGLLANVQQKHPMELRGFAKYIDVEKFIEMIKQCNSEQISVVRDIFGEVYPRGISWVSNYPEDLENLISIREKLEDTSLFESFDSIQHLQRRYLITNLDDIIKMYPKDKTKDE